MTDLRDALVREIYSPDVSWGTTNAVVDKVLALLAKRAPAPEGGAEWFGVTGAADETEALAVALFYARCPGIRMTEEDMHYYRAAAQRAMQAVEDELDTPALATREVAPAEAGVAQRVMNRADLTNATTPGHADAYLNALLDYTAGFYGEAREAGMPATSVADAMNHVERAARGLHALALRAQPQAREDAQPVAWFGDKNYEPTEAMIDAGLHHNHRSNSEANMISSFKEMMMQAEIDGLVSYTHPAPDALRRAVEALEKIKAVRVCKESANIWTGADACRKIATEALTALQGVK